MARHQAGLMHLPNERHGGRALRRAWLDSDADVVSYMDVDLSTGLDAFMPMIEPLVKGELHVATGSRLCRTAASSARLSASSSRARYNLMVKLMFPFKRFSRCALRLQGVHAAKLCRSSSTRVKTRRGSLIPSSCCAPSSAAIASTMCRCSGKKTPAPPSRSPRRPGKTSRVSCVPRPGALPDFSSWRESADRAQIR